VSLLRIPRDVLRQQWSGLLTAVRWPARSIVRAWPSGLSLSRMCRSGLSFARHWGAGLPFAALRWTPKSLTAAILVGLACGGLSLYGEPVTLEKGGRLLSIGYVAAVLALMWALPRWRAGLFLLLWTGAPPFIDYELAWVAPTGFRAPGTEGLRTVIADPVVSLLDLSLIAVALLLLASRGRAAVPEGAAAGSLEERAAGEAGAMAAGPTARLTGKSTGRPPAEPPGEAAAGAGPAACRPPAWLPPAVTGVAALQCASALRAMARFPDHAATALAGLTGALRVPLAVLAALALGRQMRRPETLAGLIAGVWLFLGQSLYITFLKYGTLRFGWVEMNGVIAGPAATGSFLVLVLPLLAAHALGSTEAPFSVSSRARWAAGITALAGAVYALFTYSRIVWLGIAVAAVLLLLLLPARSPRRLAVALCLAGIGLVVLASASGYHLSKLSGYGLDLTADWNLGRRLDYWSLTVRYLLENPLLGIGPEMWSMVRGLGTSAHNMYLQYAAESGLVAFLLWAALLAGSLLAAIRGLGLQRRAGRNTALTAGTVAGVAAFLVTQLSESTLSDHRLTVVFWTLLTFMVLPGHAPGPAEEEAHGAENGAAV